MTKHCARCGEAFEGRTARALYCGDRCRKQASRGGGTPRKVAPSAPPAEAPAAADVPVEGDVSVYTRAELVKAARLETALGAAALLAARRLDASTSADTGASIAALLREHRAALEAATRDAETAADPLDALRAGVLTVIAGGRK